MDKYKAELILHLGKLFALTVNEKEMTEIAKLWEAGNEDSIMDIAHTPPFYRLNTEDISEKQ